MKYNKYLVPALFIFAGLLITGGAFMKLQGIKGAEILLAIGLLTELLTIVYLIWKSNRKA